MKTIGAKQLRDDLGSLVRRVQRGERIQVFYRSKPAFMLSPVESRSRHPEPGSRAAMRRFVARVEAANAEPRPTVFDPKKSIKV